MSTIIYFHKGGIPRYLKFALENARFFNPDARIFLISDQRDVGLPRSRIELRSLDSLVHPRLEEFRRRYVHISLTKVEYERTCFERWFYMEQLRRSEWLEDVVYLDSDALIFHTVPELYGYMPRDKCLICSKASGPALTFIPSSLDPFLDLIIARFCDDDFLNEHRRRCEIGRQNGAMDNLTDMNLLHIAVAQPFHGQYIAASYPNHLPIGHIDHCIFANPDGLESVADRRHISRKRIFWEDVDGAFRPHFLSSEDGRKVPALVIHFQNGAKRRISRFNRVENDGWVPRRLRHRFYNWLTN